MKIRVTRRSQPLIVIKPRTAKCARCQERLPYSELTMWHGMPVCLALCWPVLS